MNDPDFLQRVISSLPGVDPNSDAVRSAFDNLTKDDKDKKKEGGDQPYPPYKLIKKKVGRLSYQTYL